MLNFLVLGLVPGTNLQINFDMIVDVLTAVMVILLAPRILRELESRRLNRNQA